MSNNKPGWLAQILCASHLHRWHYTIMGYQFQGIVYPLRSRTCERCGLTEKETLDQDTKLASWK